MLPGRQKYFFLKQRSSQHHNFASHDHTNPITWYGKADKFYFTFTTTKAHKTWMLCVYKPASNNTTDVRHTPKHSSFSVLMTNAIELAVKSEGTLMKSGPKNT